MQQKNTSLMTGIGNGVAYDVSVSGNVIYTSTDQVPKVSHHAGAATSSGIVFIFGGRSAPNGQWSNHLYAIHVGYASVPAWWQITTGKEKVVPPAREMHAMAAVGNSLYVCGGKGGSSLSGTLLGDLWVYVHVPQRSDNTNGDINSDEIVFVGNWSNWAGAALPSKVSKHKMVSTPDGKLWVFGGETTAERVVDRLMSLDTTNKSASWRVCTWDSSHATNRSGDGNSGNALGVQVPSPRGDHGMAAVGYLVYVSRLDSHALE
jgi:hypothetical protein